MSELTCWNKYECLHHDQRRPVTHLPSVQNWGDKKIEKQGPQPTPSYNAPAGVDRGSNLHPLSTDMRPWIKMELWAKYLSHQTVSPGITMFCRGGAGAGCSQRLCLFRQNSSQGIPMVATRTVTIVSIRPLWAYWTCNNLFPHWGWRYGEKHASEEHYRSDKLRTSAHHHFYHSWNHRFHDKLEHMKTYKSRNAFKYGFNHIRRWNDKKLHWKDYRISLRWEIERQKCCANYGSFKLRLVTIIHTQLFGKCGKAYSFLLKDF